MYKIPKIASLVSALLVIAGLGWWTANHVSAFNTLEQHVSNMDLHQQWSYWARRCERLTNQVRRSPNDQSLKKDRDYACAKELRLFQLLER